MTPPVVGFTGTQFGCAKPLQYEALRRCLGELRVCGALWMHNGDCIGSDHQAGLLWQWHGGAIHLHPPLIRGKRAFLVPEKSEQPAPYLYRNRKIADACTVLVATPSGFEEERRSGTWATVRYARKLGKAVTVIWPDGTITAENASSSLTEINRLNAQEDKTV